jgi:F-type H+-transporting ATPase subunit alpha
MLILLALGAGLFDTVPVERMSEAEVAVAVAATNLPTEIKVRLDSAEPLSDADRQTIISLARTLLADFQAAKTDTGVNPQPVAAT